MVSIEVCTAVFMIDRSPDWLKRIVFLFRMADVFRSGSDHGANFALVGGIGGICFNRLDDLLGDGIHRIGF